MKKIFVLFILVVSVSTLFAQRTKLMIQTGHQTTVQNMSLSPDETKVITVDSNEIGILWDLKNKKKLRVFLNIRDAQFGTDGSMLFLVYQNGNCKSVDLSGNIIKEYPSSEEKNRPEIAKYINEYNFIFYRDKITDVNTGKTRQMPLQEYHLLESMLYSPLKGIIVGEMFYLPYREPVVGSKANDTSNIFFFDVNAGKITKRLQLDFGQYALPNNFSISKDNNTLLVSSFRKANVVDLNTGKVVKVLEPKQNNQKIYSSTISPDGKNTLLVMNKSMAMIDIETEKIIWESSDSKNSHGKAIFNVSGDKIFVEYGGGIDILNGLTGKSINVVDATPISYLKGIQLVNNKTHLFRLSSNNLIVNWNLVSGKMEKSVPFEFASRNIEYTITADGKKMMIADFHFPTSMIAEIKFEDNNILRYPQVDAGNAVKNISLSFDNRYLISSRFINEKEMSVYPKSLSIYDVNTYQKVLDLSATSSGGTFANTKNLVATKNGWNSSDINIYEIPSGRLFSQITFPHGVGDYDPIIFSTSDKYLATVNDKEFCVYEFATKKYRQFRDKIAVKVRNFTPDDRYFFEGSIVDGCIYFYDMQSQEYDPSFKMQVTSTEIKAISFSKADKLMYTLDADNVIKVWNFETQTLLATLYSFPETNNWAVVSPDGHFDGTKGAQENMYYVKKLNTIDLSDMYEKFYTPHLLTRILNGEKIQGDISVDDLHPKPRIKIQYAEKTRNLEVGDDNSSYANSTGLAELTVNATAQDDKVDEIRLFHNGKIVNLTSRGLFVTDEKTGNETKKYNINLQQGQNTFRAVALNGQRTESKADEISVNYKTGENNIPVVINKPINLNVKPIDLIDKSATLHLIVVGINQYQNKKMSLNYALADATSFKDELEKDVKSVIANVKTYFVTDDAASKKGITDAFAAVQQNAKPQDVFIFYYAGHGVIGKDKEFYLVPTDVSDLANVQTELEQKGIPSKLLQQYAIDIQAQKQLFILDACQSAGAFETLMSNDGNQQKSLAVVARSTGTHWMAASGAKQYANEFASLGHGVFTYILLQALKGEAASNKQVTVNRLKNFLQIQVPTLMKKYNGEEQYPASYGFGNDFPVEVVK